MQFTGHAVSTAQGTQERWKWTHFHAVPTCCHTRVSLEHLLVTSPELQGHSGCTG